MREKQLKIDDDVIHYNTAAQKQRLQSEESNMSSELSHFEQGNYLHAIQFIEYIKVKYELTDDEVKSALEIFAKEPLYLTEKQREDQQAKREKRIQNGEDEETLAEREIRITKARFISLLSYELSSMDLGKFIGEIEAAYEFIRSGCITDLIISSSPQDSLNKFLNDAEIALIILFKAATVAKYMQEAKFIKRGEFTLQEKPTNDEKTWRDFGGSIISIYTNHLEDLKKAVEKKSNEAGEKLEAISVKSRLEKKSLDFFKGKLNEEHYQFLVFEQRKANVDPQDKKTLYKAIDDYRDHVIKKQGKDKYKALVYDSPKLQQHIDRQTYLTQLLDQIDGIFSRENKTARDKFSSSWESLLGSQSGKPKQESGFSTQIFNIAKKYVPDLKETLMTKDDINIAPKVEKIVSDEYLEGSLNVQDQLKIEEVISDKNLQKAPVVISEEDNQFLRCLDKIRVEMLTFSSYIHRKKHMRAGDLKDDAMYGPTTSEESNLEECLKSALYDEKKEKNLKDRIKDNFRIKMLDNKEVRAYIRKRVLVQSSESIKAIGAEIEQLACEGKSRERVLALCEQALKTVSECIEVCSAYKTQHNMFTSVFSTEEKKYRESLRNMCDALERLIKEREPIVTLFLRTN